VSELLGDFEAGSLVLVLAGGLPAATGEASPLICS
jgi:hypothetical protein